MSALYPSNDNCMSFTFQDYDEEEEMDEEPLVHDEF